MAVTVDMAGIVGALGSMAGGVLTAIKGVLQDAELGTHMQTVASNIDAQTSAIDTLNIKVGQLAAKFDATAGGNITDMLAAGLAQGHTDLDAIKGVMTTGVTNIAGLQDRLTDIEGKLLTIAGRLAQDGANINQSLYGAIGGVAAEIVLLKTLVGGRLASDEDENISGKVGQLVTKLDAIQTKLATGAGVVGDNVTGAVNAKLEALKTELDSSMEGVISTLQASSTAELAAMGAAFTALTNATTGVGTKIATSSSVQAAIEDIASRVAGPGTSVDATLGQVRDKLDALPNMDTHLGNIKSEVQTMGEALKPGGVSAFAVSNVDSILHSIGIDTTTLATRPTTTEVIGPRGLVLKVTEWSVDSGD